MRSLFFARNGRSLPQGGVGHVSIAKKLTELRGHLRSWIADLRRRRDYGNLVDAEATDDIAVELAASHTAAAQHAHAAEVNDRAAARLLAAALDPRSDGGAMITPREAAPIKRLILRSAEADHDITEQLA